MTSAYAGSTGRETTAGSAGSAGIAGLAGRAAGAGGRALRSGRRREQGGFLGAATVLRQLAEGPPRRLVGIRPEGRALAREGTEIHRDGSAVGVITSGGFERETSTGYEKAVKVAGYPAMETWNRPNRRAELTVIVGKRFVVNATGSGVDSAKDLHALVSRIDFAALQKLGS